MANFPFDRTIIHPLEKPFADDLNQAQSQIDRAVRTVYESLFSRRLGGVADGRRWVDGFIGDGFKVRPKSPASMVVSVTNGFGFKRDTGDVPVAIGGIVGLDDLAALKPLALSADTDFNVPAAPGGGQERIDIIEVKVDRRMENILNRDVLNPGSGVFVPTNLDKTLAFDLVGRTGAVVSPANSASGLSYKQGVPQAAGTYAGSSYVTGVPATTAGYVKLCEVLVVAGAVSIPTNKVRDTRYMLLPGGLQNYSALFRVNRLAGLPTLFNLAAPPGMRVGAVHRNTAKGEIDVYFLAGEETGEGAPIYPNITVTAAIQEDLPGGSLVASSMAWLYAVTQLFGLVDSALQADLANGAIAGTPIDVAEGTRYFGVKLLAKNFTGGVMAEGIPVAFTTALYNVALSVGIAD